MRTMSRSSRAGVGDGIEKEDECAGVGSTAEINSAERVPFVRDFLPT